MVKAPENKSGFKERFQKYTEKYRLILLKEDTYEERFATNVSVLQLMASAIAAVLLVVIVVVLLFFFTPLKQMVPGYMEDKWREDANYSRQQVDSLLNVMREKDQYVENLRVLLNGGVIRDSLLQENPGETDPAGEDIAEYTTAPEDSALRARITEEDRYLLNLNQVENDDLSANKLYLFQPLTGMLSAGYDAQINHYGIDIVAPANSLIKSVLEGTVIFASWTSDGGNVVQIQHAHNLISVYKHNSVLLKKVGDQIEAGDAIAIIGDSGDHSDGPHLHFELWQNGVPVNPEQYFVFEE